MKFNPDPWEQDVEVQNLGFDGAKWVATTAINTPAGTLTIKSDPLDVGDYVRWWPMKSDLGRYLDGAVTSLSPLCLRLTKSVGFTECVTGGYRMPAVGGVVDTSVSPGRLERIQRPLTGGITWSYAGAVTSPVVTREPASPDPLDVEYDGVPLRKLLESDIAARHETNRFAGWMKPAQRAAVSAHWSAQLRARVEASAAAERERERNRVVLDQDADDLPWRTR